MVQTSLADRSCKDDAMALNHGLFVDTPGYVLKPLALRHKLSEPTHPYHLRVRIISAQRLPPSNDISVEATLILPQSHDEERIRNTNSVKGPTLTPAWNEAFAFDFTCAPSMLDLTFLHLKINTFKPLRPLLAQWIRTLGRAPRGYHHLPLYDSLFSKYVFATLFVRIDLDILAE